MFCNIFGETMTTSHHVPQMFKSSVSKAFARLKQPSRQNQFKALSPLKISQNVKPLTSVWSIDHHEDDHQAVASICFDYEAPQGPLV
jgi:hypothetical protein